MKRLIDSSIIEHEKNQKELFLNSSYFSNLKDRLNKDKELELVVRISEIRGLGDYYVSQLDVIILHNGCFVNDCDEDGGALIAFTGIAMQRTKKSKPKLWFWDTDTEFLEDLNALSEDINEGKYFKTKIKATHFIN